MREADVVFALAFISNSEDVLTWKTVLDKIKALSKFMIRELYQKTDLFCYLKTHFSYIYYLLAISFMFIYRCTLHQRFSWFSVFGFLALGQLAYFPKSSSFCKMLAKQGGVWGVKEEMWLKLKGTFTVSVFCSTKLSLPRLFSSSRMLKYCTPAKKFPKLKSYTKEMTSVLN